MKWFKELKKKFKYVLGIAAAALMISQVISPALGTSAEGPRFNFLEGDQELFRGANSTKEETVWKDPVSGEVGDTLTGLVYYHNGVLDTVAENTRIKVNMPAETAGDQAVLRATISADNAEAVSDTIVDGTVVGKSGLMVNLNKPAELELVPGSVKWFPNQKSNPGVSQPLPFGQNGSEILSSGGLNIGNINGCWEFAGYVMFQFKTKAKVVPGNLAIEKSVRNVSKGETSYANETIADQNDTVEFKIDVTNTGGSNMTNVLASDELPSELKKVDGSLTVVKGGETLIINEAAYFGAGTSIGDLLPGSSNKATIKFKAKAPAEIVAAKTVTNIARASSAGINVSDTACVLLKPGVANIVKSKSAFNKTLGVDATSTAARPGDEIEYTLNTKNTGTIAKEYVIEDAIGDVLEEANVLSVSDGGVVVDGTPGTNESKIVRWPKVTINPGENVVRTFTVKVKDPLPTEPQDGYHFDNKMFNIYGNEVLIIIVPPHREPALTINKTVRNVTRNDLDYVKSNTAFPGDTLEYKIDFANMGTAPADKVTVSDVLPPNVALDTTAAAIINLDGTEHSISQDITKGFVINSLAPGQSGYVRFRVITSSNIAAGEHLVNTGYLTDDGKTISSTAETVILTKVVTASTLPKTGAAGGILSAITAMFAGVNLTYLKQKKLIAKAARAAIAN